MEYLYRATILLFKQIEAFCLSVFYVCLLPLVKLNGKVALGISIGSWTNFAPRSIAQSKFTSASIHVIDAIVYFIHSSSAFITLTNPVNIQHYTAKFGAKATIGGFMLFKFPVKTRSNSDFLLPFKFIA